MRLFPRWGDVSLVPRKALAPCFGVCFVCTSALWQTRVVGFLIYCVVLAALAATISQFGLFQRASWSLQFLYFLFGWISCLVSAAPLPGVLTRLNRDSSLSRVALVLSLPNLLLLLGRGGVPESVQGIACLFPPASMYFGSVLLNNAEVTLGGARWANALRRVPGTGVRLPFGVVLGLQAAGWAVCAFVAWKYRERSPTPTGSVRTGPCIPPDKRQHRVFVEEVPLATRLRRSFEVSRVCKVRICVCVGDVL
jgi:hypothetical protein